MTRGLPAELDWVLLEALVVESSSPPSKRPLPSVPSLIWGLDCFEPN